MDEVICDSAAGTTQSQITSVDAAIEAVAVDQLWLVAAWQLLALGVSRAAIRHRVSRGRLRKVHPGVYSVGPASVTRRWRWLAAVLACGPGARLGYASAAELWRLLDPADRLPSVIVAYGRRRSPGIRAHRVSLAPDEVTSHRRIPVTTPTRTLLDIAWVLGERALHEAVRRADRADLLETSALLELCDRSRGRRGVASLRRVLAEFVPTDPRTVSPLEDELRAFVGRHGLPQPAVNVRVGPYIVDFAWVDAGVVVETDGWQDHRLKPAFDADRKRFGKLQVLGWKVLPVTARRLHDDDADLLADVRAMLELSRSAR